MKIQNIRAHLLLVLICASTQGATPGPLVVDGVTLSGNIDAAPTSEIRAVITTYKHFNGEKPAELTLINKNEIHVYTKLRDLGWLTLKRNPYGEWGTATIRSLPEFSAALHCMIASQSVYIFPVTTPLKPYLDNKHLRLLDTNAHKELVDILESKNNWYVGFYEIGLPDKIPADIGLLFRNGNDKLILFFLSLSNHWVSISGTFNGERLSGVLEENSIQELEKWKRQYARPELQNHR